MRFVTLVVLPAILFSAGCNPGSDPATQQPSAAQVTETGPWATVANEDDFGSIGSDVTFQDDGPDVIQYDLNCVHFGDLLRDIGEMTECTVTCDSPALLKKGVTVKIQGAGAQAVLQDLATKLNLKLTGQSPAFHLSQVDAGTAN